jgi:multidrug efflux system membrane fusion protein
MKIRSSYLWAGLVALGVVGWMVSDDFLRPQADDAGVEISSSDVTAIDAPMNDGDSSAGAVPQPASVDRSFIVSAVRVKNETIPRLIRANGIIEPEYEVTVSSKIDGNIVAVPGREGASVKAGDVLVVLDKGTLPAQITAARAEIQAAEMALNAAREQSRGTLEEELAAAEANLAVAKKRMEISKKLAQQNFSAPLEQVQLKADFENARVTLAKIRLKQNFQADIEVSQNTARLEAARSNLSVLTSQSDDSTIVAPIDGRLETIHVDAGERLRRDQAAATILGMDRLSVVVAVPQTNVSRISIGDMVKVDIAGAGTHQGQVAKIASQTSAATRTFDVEITVPNDEGKAARGVTVEAAIDIGSVNAFALSPAHLSVAGDGSLTVKVSDTDTVRIIPVEMVRSGAERVYVSGLEDGMILLTVGQAFVDAGDTVNYALGDNS